MKKIILAGLALMLSAAAARAADIVLQWQTANLTEKQFEPVWKAMIAEFEAANPGIRVEPILVARKDHWTKFVTAAQARKAPCLVSVDVATAAYNGYLMPLDAFWNAEPEAFRRAWSDDVLKAAQWKGKLYGVPIWGGVYGEIYNAEMVRAAGLDPAKPPVTWAEYLTWAKALTGNGHWATAILGGKTDTTTRVLLSWIYSNAGEPFNADMTEATFAKNAKSLEAIKFYIELMSKHGVVAPGPTTTNYLEQTVLFAQGKIATMRNAYWAMAKAEDDNPALKGKMIAAAPPHNGTGPATLATMSASSIAAGCATPEAAWKFIKFEADTKWSVARVRTSNWMPLRRDLMEVPEIKGDAMLTTFLEIGRTARAYPLAHPIWADIAAGDIVDAVQAALLKPDQIEPIFRALDSKLTKKLNDF